MEPSEEGSAFYLPVQETDFAGEGLLKGSREDPPHHQIVDR